MKKIIIVIIILIGVLLMIYGLAGNLLDIPFKNDGSPAESAYSVSGDEVFPYLPIPSGNLVVSESIALPDIYGTGHGFTCTGLAYDAINDVFLVGDIGKPLPNSGTIASQIVKLRADFETVVGTIDLENSNDVQGIALDADGTIWCCFPAENKIRHIASDGESLGVISVTKPTGIAYSHADDTFWVLNYDNKILHINKSGDTIATYNFSYNETLDQCFLDNGRGLLYITAGTNYSGRNNVYCFNTTTNEQSVACTVDSYSVEGIWIGPDKMVIVNDGYYHSATVPVNQTNIYMLD